MYQLKQLLTRRVSIAALTLITGFGLVLLSGFFDYKVKRITLNFMGFTNTGTRTELLFSVSNDPGGFTMEAVNIERKDGSRWVRENNTDVPVTPYAPSA